MAKTVLRPQGYPRIKEGDKYHGFLDESELVDHQAKLGEDELKKIILESIVYANKKSSRKLLVIDPSIDGADLIKFYKKIGKELFQYFVKYCGDPASTAYDSVNKSYKDVAKENFRNRTLQKERMNSGWRYQHIAKDAARNTGRFESVSDLNLNEADFNAAVKYKHLPGKLNVYVSIKNRTSTMGGQDWPKAIAALEAAAAQDKNRDGYYLCVFGMAMERGDRTIKNSRKANRPYSENTEVWNSDFFWPFFANSSYEEIVKGVLNVLVAAGDETTQEDDDIQIPDELIEEFGSMCNQYGLLDDGGHFSDAYRLVDLFCGKLKLPPKAKVTKTTGSKKVVKNKEQ